MIDPDFHSRVAPLQHYGMGTENAAPFLYSLVRMLRPRTALEVGLGYTTPFLLKALSDAKSDWERDHSILSGKAINAARHSTLYPDSFVKPYKPKLIAIDDFSIEESNAARVRDIVETLGLSDLLIEKNGDFRDFSDDLTGLAPIDFIWFDCGGPNEYMDFLNGFWPLLNTDHGVLILHFTYSLGNVEIDGMPQMAMLPSQVLRAVQDTIDENVELVSLIEPNKFRQGSLTILRRVPAVEKFGVADLNTDTIELKLQNG